MENREVMRTDGAGAAALVAAGIGCLAMGVFTILGGQTAHTKALFTLWKPTGPLSGVSTAAIVAWLVSWALLHKLWVKKIVSMKSMGMVALLLLLLGFLLTFPPVMEKL